jgi:hypothetical protein
MEEIEDNDYFSRMEGGGGEGGYAESGYANGEYIDENEEKDPSMGNDEDYKDEVGVYDRAGPESRLQEFISSYTDDKRIRTSEDRFLIDVDTFSRKFTEDGIFKLTTVDINKMLEKTRNIKKLKYLNPLCYILGYIATSGGIKLDPLTVKKVIDDILPEIDKNYGIEPPDVVRYSRFWKMIL